MVRKLNYIFTRTDKVKLVFLLIAVIFGSFLELLAVSVFSPFINLIMDTDILQENPMLLEVYRFFS